MGCHIAPDHPIDLELWRSTHVWQPPLNSPVQLRPSSTYLHVQCDTPSLNLKLEAISVWALQYDRRLAAG